MKDEAICENSQWLEAINYFFKSLILDYVVWLSSEYVSVYGNYFCFVLDMYFVSGMVQPKYWYSPATSP